MAIVNRDALEGRDDFIGFTFNGHHSSEFHIINVNTGNRTGKELLPSPSHTTAQVTGVDGKYFFNTTFPERKFSINIAYDDLKEEDFRKIENWLSFRQEGSLIFDEQPYRQWTGKISSAVKMNFICFDDYDGQRVYKGEGTFEFTCFYPWSISPFMSMNQFKADYRAKWERERGEEWIPDEEQYVWENTDKDILDIRLGQTTEIKKKVDQWYNEDEWEAASKITAWYDGQREYFEKNCLFNADGTRADIQVNPPDDSLSAVEIPTGYWDYRGNEISDSTTFDMSTGYNRNDTTVITRDIYPVVPMFNAIMPEKENSHGVIGFTNSSMACAYFRNDVRKVGYTISNDSGVKPFHTYYFYLKGYTDSGSYDLEELAEGYKRLTGEYPSYYDGDGDPERGQLCCTMGDTDIKFNCPVEINGNKFYVQKALNDGIGYANTPAREEPYVGTTISIYNAGNMWTYPKIIISVYKEAVLKKKYLDNRISDATGENNWKNFTLRYFATNGNGLCRQDMSISEDGTAPYEMLGRIDLDLSKLCPTKEDSDDPYFMFNYVIDCEKHLIEKIIINDYGDNFNYTTTGEIRNDAIVAGDFFEIPPYEYIEKKRGAITNGWTTLVLNRQAKNVMGAYWVPNNGVYHDFIDGSKAYRFADRRVFWDYRYY